MTPECLPQPDIYEHGSEAFLGALNEVWSLHCEKAQEFDRPGESFTNMRAVSRFGIEPWRQCVVQCQECMSRMERYLDSGAVEPARIENALKDLASYAVMGLVLYRETLKGRAVSDGEC